MLIICILCFIDASSTCFALVAWTVHSLSTNKRFLWAVISPYHCWIELSFWSIVWKSRVITASSQMLLPFSSPRRCLPQGQSHKGCPMKHITNLELQPPLAKERWTVIKVSGMRWCSADVHWWQIHLNIWHRPTIPLGSSSSVILQRALITGDYVGIAAHCSGGGWSGLHLRATEFWGQRAARGSWTTNLLNQPMAVWIGNVSWLGNQIVRWERKDIGYLLVQLMKGWTRIIRLVEANEMNPSFFPPEAVTRLLRDEPRLCSFPCQSD